METKAKSTQTRLASYLQRVGNGELLNFTVLERELRKKSVPQSSIDRCFSAQLLKPNQYRVQILDIEYFDSLLNRFSENSTVNRKSAALSGDSHRARVGGSFLLLRNQRTPQPVVVWFEDYSYHCPVEPSRYVLLVENLENYIAAEQMVLFLNQNGWVIGSEQVDVIYASGNQITNQLHRQFLEGYKQIYCLFDVDLGALKMYKALCQMLTDKTINFVYPKDVVQRLHKSERNMSTSERADLLNYVGLSVELDELIVHMRDSGNKLEQEIYIEL
jgi:hypothetical protein